MKIEYLRLKNFRSFKKLEMKEIPNFCVIVGANGTGKSSLFSIFIFLREALKSNIHTALTQLGGSKGFKEVRTRGETGDIEIELKFRENANSPLITYMLCISEENDHPIIKQEVLKYRRGSRGKPWSFLDFSNGKGMAVTNELDKIADERSLKREEQSLKSPDILAIKGLAQFQKFSTVVALGNLIENWHISDLHIIKARNEPEAGYAEHLSKEGENVALVLEFLYKRYPEIFQKICDKLSERIPGIAKVQAKITEEGRVLLNFYDSSFKEPFLSKYISDGTIKMLEYLVLLYDPVPYSLLCVEEPENQLYPKLLLELAEEFRSYANQGGQAFVSTHSPDFLNAIQLEEVFWFFKENGYTQAKKASDDSQVSAYMKDGDKMGYLWKEGFFKGVDPE